MSPELLLGKPVDARSDIFSLGCVLYEMLSGQRLFARRTAAETMTAILNEDPPDLTGTSNTHPLGLERAIRHCLEKDPERRFQSVRDLEFNLQALLSDSGVEITGLVTKTNAQKTASRRRKTIDSLAVLPLANASADPQTEYFSDGITESIINMLSRLPKLRVMARSTSFRYKGKDIDPCVAGAELGIQAVLVGRVQFLGDRLTIGVELVKVADGSQIWGEQYNRKLADIFSVQEEISKDIADNLRLRLTKEDKCRLVKRDTMDTEAYRLYLQGRFYWNKRTEKGLTKAIEFFQQALEKDANYSLAYTGLADAYNNLGSYSIWAEAEAFPKAKAAAFKALELEETQAEAHVSLAFAMFIYDWDWAGAQKEFERALELNPDYSTAHHWYAWYLLAVGRLTAAVAEMQRAVELDPLALPINTNLGFAYYYSRQYDQAIDHFRKTLEMDATFAEAHRGLGESLEQQGLFEEAIAELQQAHTLAGGSMETLAHLGHTYALAGKRVEAQEILDRLKTCPKDKHVSSHDIANLYTALGETEDAFHWLGRAYGEHCYRLAWLKVDPKMDSLREDPRFGELLRQMHL